ncbi:MAG TPA: hypothetical protein DD791_11900 [Syntrophomonas sp.]|jgi:uncharacterized membrane protein|nr:hypothetical protein [Syntrophomonas sp.]
MSLSKKYNKRPVLKLPLTGWEKGLEVLSVLGVLFVFLLVYQSWGILPDRIPTHFGFTGAPDAWGNKGNLFFLPLIALAMYLLLTIVSRFPHTFNYPVKITEENAATQYIMARYLIAVLKVETIWLFVYIQWVTIEVALGKAMGLSNLFLPIFLVVMLGTLVVYFYKAREKR